MAEVGHSSMGRKKNLSLVDAAKDDVANFMLQEQEINGFNSGDMKPLGKGPNQEQRANIKKRGQIRRGHEYGKLLSSKTKDMEAEISGETDHHALPKKRSSHKAPPPGNNDLQINTGPKTKKKRAPSKKVTPTSATGTSNAAQTLASSSTVPVNDIPIANNPPIIIFCQGTMRKCHGCGGQFKTIHRKPPRDFIFKMNCYRQYTDLNGTRKTSDFPSPCYFHLNMRCLRIKIPILEPKHIIMYDETWENLSEAQKAFLDQQGFLRHIKQAAAP